MMTKSPVVNVGDVTLGDSKNGAAFEARLGSIAAPLGAKQLGCRLTVVPPGKRAWPYHCHHANEEMFVILEGEGTLRFGNEQYPLKFGDVAMCPTGGPETAHQIINTGESDLRYLAISTMMAPEVMEYPDSGKWGAYAGAAPGGDLEARTFSSFVPSSASIDYWEGEDGSEDI